MGSMFSTESAYCSYTRYAVFVLLLDMLFHIFVVLIVLDVGEIIVGGVCWNKVKINPVVKYDWEHRRYIGNLIAVHLNRTHVAYVLRGMTDIVKTAIFMSLLLRVRLKASCFLSFHASVLVFSCVHAFQTSLT